MTADAAKAADLGESALVFNMPLGDPDAVSAWLENASAGDSAVYFVGHLAVARDPLGSPFGRAAARDAGKTADIMRAGAEQGLLQLSQKRIADGCFLYIGRRLVSKKLH